MPHIQTSEKSLKDLIPYGGVEWIAKDSGYSRYYVSEYISNPVDFKGSQLAAKKILASIEKLLNAREAQREANLQRMNSLLNKSDE